MIISTVLLTSVGFYAEKNFSFIINQFWFASGLLLLVLLSLIDQPHFSKDANIFVNGITAALSLLLLGSEQHDVLFWVFLYYTAYLIISSYILMWKRNNPLHIEGNAVQFFSRLNRQIGKPEVIFSTFFLWGAVKQYTLNSNQFNALLWFWAESGKVISNRTGISVASGRTLTMSAATLTVCSFLFSIRFYLISFFPNWVAASAKTGTKAKTAQGRKGISEKAVSADAVVNSCREQDTRYPL